MEIIKFKFYVREHPKFNNKYGEFSNGYWIKRKYDENNKTVMEENSYGSKFIYYLFSK